MSQKVIVLGLGWEQEPMMDALAKEDVDLYGIHYNQDYYRGVDFKEVLVCDMLDLTSILAFAEKVRPDYVISDQDDYAYFGQAVIADKFNIPGPSIADAQLAINKFNQREKVSELDIKLPKYFRVKDLNDLDSAMEKLSFPVIIKPTDSRGSFGVSKVVRAEDLKDAFYHALSNSPSKTCIIEEFIEGFEITIDGYFFAGKATSLALAKKGKLNNETMVSVDIKYPGELIEDTYSKALALNEKIADHLYSFGMIHAEYIVTPDQDLYLVEMANRGGGCYTSELIVPAVSGVDLVAQYVSDCMGNDSDFYSSRKLGEEVILKFFSFAPGVIDEIKGVEEVKSHPNLINARILVKEGEEIKPISTDANRHGFLIVKSTENVREICDNLISKINVVYKKH